MDTLRAKNVAALTALALLAGCGASAPPVAPPVEVSHLAPISRPAHAFREVPAPDWAKKGIYVSQFYGADIFGFPYDNRRNKPPFCQVSGVQTVQDIALDIEGNLIVPDGGSHTIKLFRGPGMCGAGFGSIVDPYGRPSDAASADAATGTIVVGNIEDGSGSKESSGKRFALHAQVRLHDEPHESEDESRRRGRSGEERRLLGISVESEKRGGLDILQTLFRIGTPRGRLSEL